MTDVEYKQLAALIQLLDEPDEAVFNQIRVKVMEYGPVALPLLEESWMQLSNEGEVTRIEGLMDHIRLNDTFDKLKQWVSGDKGSLLEPYLLISAFHESEFNSARHRNSVEKIFRDVWLEMNSSLTALERIKVINHIFYDVYGFKGLPDNRPNLPSYLLSNVLRTQKGNPLSLGLLYLIVAQRAQLPVFGVNLPTHFILVYMDDVGSSKSVGNYSREEVLFYLNPFNKGTLFRSSEIALFLKQLKIKEAPQFFMPGDNLSVLRRLIREMIAIHWKNNNRTKVKALNYLLTALE